MMPDEHRKLQVPLAENLANMLLQPKAAQRLSAEDALRHHYFAELPPAIHDLGDGESVLRRHSVQLFGSTSSRLFSIPRQKLTRGPKEWK